MKKKQLMLLSVSMAFACALQAESIKLSPEQEKNWQIKREKPQISDRLPLGELMVEVVTPPALLRTISLPFEANVKNLYVANYQSIEKGQILAEVTGTEWIETQQRAISDAIELKHHTHLAERKNMLCKEEIIPQKECAQANAELASDRIKIATSKALLKSYGATPEMISNIFNALQISQTIQLKSPTDGSIVGINASPGKSNSPANALFVIQEKGSLWLEGQIENGRTEGLYTGQDVHVKLANHAFDTVILQLSPVVNPENQTRQIRFLVPIDSDVLTGLRGAATITLSLSTLKLKKTSVIKEGGKQIVFVKSPSGFETVSIEILGEDDTYYFVKNIPALQSEVAISSIAILKNMLGSEDE